MTKRQFVFFLSLRHCRIDFIRMTLKWEGWRWVEWSDKLASIVRRYASSERAKEAHACSHLPEQGRSLQGRRYFVLLRLSVGWRFAQVWSKLVKRSCIQQIATAITKTIAIGRCLARPLSYHQETLRLDVFPRSQTLWSLHPSRWIIWVIFSRISMWIQIWCLILSGSDSPAGLFALSVFTYFLLAVQCEKSSIF